MHKFSLSRAIVFPILIAAAICPAQSPSSSKAPVSVLIYDRTRLDAWSWFAAPPAANTYGYAESLLRAGVAQRLHRWDWELEIAQPAVLDVPGDAVSSIGAQGQLGLGGTYYASSYNTEPAAAFLKQGFVRFDGEKSDLRIGRFEFFEGQETKPTDPTLAWLQINRIAQRLIGNFGFSNAQRSLDGADMQWNKGGWNITAMAGRADQGVFNMNGNPELNVDAQYLAATRSEFGQHLLWRVFASAYHDGRTGITKTDNRPLAIREADHRNIRIGTYGGDVIAAIPVGPGKADLLFWGVLQNGRWGLMGDAAGAAAFEGGYQFTRVRTMPWLRGGWFRSTGDNNPAGETHHTFFQMLPTPRLYARLPFFNLMNNKDGFVQWMDRPVKSVAVRTDLHWISLTSPNDLWYAGGGAYDNTVFGYLGRPANNATSLASLYDASADWQVTKSVALNFYYAYAQGKSVVAAIYPAGRNMQYGYAEFVYSWDSRR